MEFALSQEVHTIEKELVTNKYFLVSARVNEIQDVLLWDEQAKIVSTGSGYSSPEDRERRLENLKKMIDDLNYQIQFIKDIAGRNIGCVMINLKPPAETPSEPITSTILHDNSDTINLEEFNKILSKDKANSGRAHIDSITIASDLRGQGVGTSIIDQLSLDLKSKGYQYLSLDTGVNNYAMVKASKGFGLKKL
ncbi:MAG: Acetyltransferase family protein [Candidatus Collierbacteria bacterium GW2011_GWB2_44_22]|uniref:Acetyltransferase family protein n=1 Tax=Candidatus Collierbacteria bacterium GW2011_GWB2_44_22 TaxID=1618387 RepID=A0A0G1KU37_9BACT|nr:MAG: Acetyltransferase family protein [Candidatus Collierbacteria bacterium GW2011_GWB2_44_22]